MSENFSIKTNNFDGPFDLLLEMIQKKKFSINDISLSKITDDYISFVKENELTLSNASYFVHTAATLMLLKSKSLLPKLSLEKDEEDDVNILKSRLRFLKEIKETSINIKNIFSQNILHKKIYKKKVEIKFRPDDSISLKNILLSLDRLVVRSPLIEKLPEVSVEKQRTLKEVIDEVTEKVNRFLKINFSEITNNNNIKDKSISFLAILELFRNGKIELSQEESFGNIIIEKK
jgi:segregation and condensation protein A